MAPRVDYFFKETLQSLRRNGLVTFATVSTVFIALFLGGVAMLAQKQTSLIIDRATDNVEVSVFLEDTISADQQTRLQKLLEDMPETSSVTYESKQQAWERFQEIFAEQQELVQNTSPDALPASFRVKLFDTNQFEVVKARLAGEPGIDTIVDHADFLKRLNAVTGVIRYGMGLLAVVMLIAAGVLIGNTIRMAVAARSREIGIMRLVGATNWFIRVPFLIEGMLVGLVGAVMAVLGLYFTNGVFVEGLRQNIEFVQWVQARDVFPNIPVLLLVGVGVAVLASFVAMRRPLET
jgi:cell division transport system permease protein